jgi:hypothetical protein
MISSSSPSVPANPQRGAANSLVLVVGVRADVLGPKIKADLSMRTCHACDAEGGMAVSTGKRKPGLEDIRT